MSRALRVVLPDPEPLHLAVTDGCCSFRVDGVVLARARLRVRRDDEIILDGIEWRADACDVRRVLALLHALFETHPELNSIALDPGDADGWLNELAAVGAMLPADASDGFPVSRRAMLLQLTDFWLTQPRRPFPLSYTVTDGKRHPLRPPIPTGEVYRRFVPSLGCRLSFVTIDPDRHLDAFHRWMNDPRVASFWELAGTREEHRAYLAKTLSDHHMHPVVGCFDGQPFGYFEIYWAKEDRIAPFYAVDDYDRGVHMLVGEPKHRGPHRVAAWLPSLAHYLFLDDPRTRNVVAEPRADNAKMIGYLRQAGFYKEKEFDFPHKRAAMMILPREVFFEQYCI